tara:strand:+ start:44 stop:1120 length:1077 start_codon:yes stop_codon:yes gene_type:complete
MALYRIFPTQDASLYSQSPEQNTGRDELLEIGGYPIAGVGNTVRTVIQFKTSDFTDTLTNKASLDTIGHGGAFSASLHLALNFAQELPVTFTLEGVALSKAWNEGVGKFGDRPLQKAGCSWTASDSGNNWATPGGDVVTLNNGVDLTVSQSFDKTTPYDINMNVTDLVSQWASGSTPLANYGLLLKIQSSYENFTESSIRLKYYGSDTNTIYPPHIDIKWDDFTHTTGSLPELTDSDAVITINNNKGEYADQGKVRFRLNARPKYPTRTFTTSSAFLKNFHLPTSSYWGLRDEYTEEMVVDFDTTFTKISCDSKSNYFDFYLDGIQPERFYRLLIKTEIDGSDIVIDNDQIFKVVRNG